MSFENVPKNSIWAAGVSREAIKTIYRVKTTTNVNRGSGVEYDTDDDHVKTAAADSQVCLGVVERNLTNPAWDGTAATLTAEDQLEIIPRGMAAKCAIPMSASCLPGAKITPDGTGAFKALQVDTTAHANACCGYVTQAFTYVATVTRVLGVLQ